MTINQQHSAEGVLRILQQEFNLKPEHIANIIELIDGGSTIPFIARYRKEMTGSLDDQILRELNDRLIYLRNLAEKRDSYKATIEEQGNMTPEILAALENATTLALLEDIYRPFRPKRRTRATIAKERGLSPLADIIWEQTTTSDIHELATTYIDPENDVPTAEDAVTGAMDIIAELISDDADNRAVVRELFTKQALLTSVATKPNEQSVYEMYYNFAEPVSKIAGHRVLATNRGEKEGYLKITLELDETQAITTLDKRLNKRNQATGTIIADTIADSYKRLIQPSIEREIRNQLSETSEEGAIKVFSENLKQLLLAAPIKDKVVLALDPGFRTGCKTCIIDGTGKVLYTGVIYPTPPASKIEESKRKLLPLIEKHGVEIIAIGNGTASRETEMFVVDMLKEAKLGRDIFYVIVNEAGASVYSASKLAAAEFPDFDVALRSAVSIGRRLQDPLAELVKIDPKSIGVGQYQHDMNQKRLEGSLSGVVEACVNSVGVDLNTASPQLLSYVAGISATVSKNILAHREQTGKFKNRKELLKVKGLGPKAYEQCAGFLRITDGDNPLDKTGVHPESYAVATHLTTQVAGGSYASLNLNQVSEELGIGLPTLRDIVKELEKPGRDPRDDMPKPILRQDVLSMEDLSEGMLLKGVVRNIIDFGAFVDIGVHQDGLVHISQITDRYIKHPLEVLSVGDIIEVAVLSVDVPKKRIGLTMKLPKNKK